MRKMIDPKKGKAIEEAIIFLVKNYIKSGRNPKPVMLHSLRVAFYLLENDYDLRIVEASIVHDLLEDSDIKLKDINLKFGKKIAEIVDSLTFKSNIEDKEKQYKEMFARAKKAGRKALIIRCADIFDNSFYIKLVNNKEKEIFLLNKLKYFLNISRPMISRELVWKDLSKRAREENKRINKKYKINL